MISDEDNISIGLESLRQLLKSARNLNELTFLCDNTPNTIIDNYYLFYLRPIGLFNNSTHTFDEELTVQKEFDKLEIYKDDQIFSDYQFVQSVDEELIQVSDCIVGLIGKYYKWINEISHEEILNLDSSLNEKQKQTLNLFAQVISKSEKESVYYVHSIESLDEHDKSARVLQWALKSLLEQRIKDFIKMKTKDRF